MKKININKLRKLFKNDVPKRINKFNTNSKLVFSNLYQTAELNLIQSFDKINHVRI